MIFAYRTTQNTRDQTVAIELQPRQNLGDFQTGKKAVADTFFTAAFLMRFVSI